MRPKSAAQTKRDAAQVETFGYLRLMPSKIVAYELHGVRTVLHYQVGPCPYSFTLEGADALDAAVKLRKLFEGEGGRELALAEHLDRPAEEAKPKVRLKRTDSNAERVKVST